MGDIIEFSTGPKNHHKFYKLTSSALSLEIRAPSDAGIGLTNKMGPTCDFWIAIGYENKCRIKKSGVTGCAKADTPNILSSNEYKRFWISWDSGCLQLGKHEDTNPIISYVDLHLEKLKYITFGSINERIAVHWKVELPPVSLWSSLTPSKPITCGKLIWVTDNTQLPDNAIIGGFEKENVYIIRARHRLSLTPGKFVPSEGVGYIPWGGVANEKNDFEVLCGYDCTWVPSSEDKIPVGAVEAGFSESNMEKLYIGRVYTNGDLVPGKVQPSHKVCYIPYDGREVASKKYEILIQPMISTICANKLLISPLYVETGDEDDYDQIDEDNSDYEDDE